ncbi:MAG: 1,4-dihydroxy-6-naphthoate synthase [Candidatus Cloacimonetes bacterium]|nr:1,4-dihydroxy-6-naphthoate synthase [Candidatus Cloacimonadota bacterium]
MKLAISPCPNDTFIFYALLHQKIKIDFDINVQYEDIATLNQWAIDQKFDFIKLSFGCYPYIKDNYHYLQSGSALGHGCGPLLLAKGDKTVFDNQSRVDIPGKYTTANLLLNHFYPNLTNKTVCLFSEITERLLQNKSDLGLVIHETRFTYHLQNLNKIADLGQLWEEKYNLPIPLGGIFYKKSISQDMVLEMQTAIEKSIEYSWNNQDEVLEFCQQYAQEMDKDVMLQHIKLYVNEYSLKLGSLGNQAIEHLFNTAP